MKNAAAYIAMVAQVVWERWDEEILETWIVCGGLLALNLLWPHIS